MRNSQGKGREKKLAQARVLKQAKDQEDQGGVELSSMQMKDTLGAFPAGKRQAVVLKDDATC